MLTESRGVLALQAVSPGRRTEDASKFKLTIRDALLLFVGGLGMFGTQILTQAGMRSDIRDLKTSVEAAARAQDSKVSELQRQIDEWRTATKLNAVYIDEAKNKLSELKGILVGAGVKGIPK